MYVPLVRERVRVDGREEIYRVVNVDKRRHCADLACIERVAILMHVPLEKIHPTAESRPSR